MLTWFKYSSQLLCKRLFGSFFEMPFCAVINRLTKKGTIIEDWESAQKMVAIVTETYTVKFETKIQALRYIKNATSQLLSESNNIENNHAEELAKQNNLKRKREKESEEQTKHVKSVVKDLIKKMKMSFNSLQIAIANLPELSETCAEEIQTLNDKVAFKLSEILKVKKTKLPEVDLANTTSNKRQALENQGCSNQSRPSSSSSSLPTSGFLPTPASLHPSLFLPSSSSQRVLSLPSSSQRVLSLPSSSLQRVLSIPSSSSQRPLSIPSSSSSSLLKSLSLPPSASKVCSSDLPPSELEAGKSAFSINNDDEVVAFTDGSCSNNGTSKASAGAGVWFGLNHPLNASIKVPGKQTNNNAEIYAVIKAIERVKATGLTKINIRTDSDFTVKSVSDWLPKWLSNGWKTNTNQEVKNKDMFLMLHKTIKQMEKVTMTHVPAHKGITGNEEADKLAKYAAKM